MQQYRPPPQQQQQHQQQQPTIHFILLPQTHSTYKVNICGSRKHTEKKEFQQNITNILVIIASGGVDIVIKKRLLT